MIHPKQKRTILQVELPVESQIQRQLYSGLVQSQSSRRLMLPEKPRLKPLVLQLWPTAHAIVEGIDLVPRNQGAGMMKTTS